MQNFQLKWGAPVISFLAFFLHASNCLFALLIFIARRCQNKDLQTTNHMKHVKDQHEVMAMKNCRRSAIDKQT